MACRDPIRSERHSSHRPTHRAAPKPIARVTVSMVCSENPDADHMGGVGEDDAGAGGGSHQDRTVPGAPRLSTQLHRGR